MFRIKKVYDVLLILLFISAMLLSSLYLPLVLNLFSLCVIFIVLMRFSHLKSDWQFLKTHHLLFPILLTSIAEFICIYHSPNLSLSNGLKTFILNDYLGKYMLVYFISIAFLNSSISILKLNALLFRILVFMTIIGCINLVLRYNPYIAILPSAYNALDFSVLYSDTDRFRVNSTFNNAFDYGFASLVFFLYFITAYIKRQISYKKLCVIIVCTFFGIITCGCRTILVCTVGGLLIWFFLNYRLPKTLKYVICGVIAVAILANSLPIVAEQIDLLFSIFDDSSKTRVIGSSIDMRKLQFMRVMWFIKEDILLGRGYQFFEIQLGWGKHDVSLMDNELFGLEGIYLSQLLERGVIGLFSWLFFYVSLIILGIKFRKIDKQYSSLLIAIVVTFILFSFMTGELLSARITLLFGGLILGILIHRKCHLNKM